MLLTVFQSCSDAEIEDKTDRSDNTDPDLVWADSVMKGMDLRAKAGQLLILQAPESADTAILNPFLRQEAVQLSGGLIFGEQGEESIRRISYSFSEKAVAPAWFAIDADLRVESPQWLRVAGGPDSLAGTCADVLGSRWKSLGIQVVFGGMARLSDDEADPKSLGSDPDRAMERSRYMAQGFKKSGLLPVMRPMGPAMAPGDSTGIPVLRDSLVTLRKGPLAPFAGLCEPAEGALQTAWLRLHKEEAAPLPFSALTHRDYIRKGLDYQGLIFSPSFRDSSLFPDDLGPGQAEARSLASGSDLIVAPSDAERTLQAIEEAVKTGQISEADLNNRVREILRNKARFYREGNPVPHPDSTLLPEISPEWLDLPRLVAEEGMCLLRNKHDRLPLKSVEHSKVAVLAVGTRRKSTFQRRIDSYVPALHYVQPSTSITASGMKSQADRLSKMDYALVCLHPEAGNEGKLKPEVRDFLAKTDSTTRLVVINMGPPGYLEGLEGLPAVVHAGNDDGLTQEVAAQAVMGARTLKGQLPVSSGAFTAGEGLNSGKPIRLGYAEPSELGMDAYALRKADSVAWSAIRLGALPGCQVLAAKDGKIFYRKAFGYHTYDRVRKVELGHLYDVASVTKVAATTLAVMRSYEWDSISLNDSLRQVIPEMDSAHIRIKDIRLSDLLIHKAGLPPGLPSYRYFTMADSADSIRGMYYHNSPDDSMFTVKVDDDIYFNQLCLDTLNKRICRTVLDPARGYTYSDLGFFLLKEVIESRHEVGLDTFVTENFYWPLGLRHTTFRPLEKFEEEEICPTEDDRWFRKQLVHGYVHDPNAALLGGVSGHAGLFSTVDDLAILMQMLLNGGEYAGKRFFNQKTVDLFTHRYPGSHRGLGWDMHNPKPDRPGLCSINASRSCFGHTGFTGTCLWADPENDVLYVFLSNRVYPKSKNQGINIYHIRQNIQSALYDALGIFPSEKVMYADTPADTLETTEDTCPPAITGI